MNLDEVLQWYLADLDCQKSVALLIKKSPSSLPLTSLFAGKTESEARQLIDAARTELEDLTILSLFAVFEASVVDHLVANTTRIKSLTSDVFSAKVCEYAFEKPERWKLEDILDFFKSTIPSDIVGNVKQIYQYRNWVAHGKTRPKPISLDPRTAHTRLSDFLNRASI